MKELKMSKRLLSHFSLIVCIIELVLATAGQSAPEGRVANELVTNPTFELAEGGELPAGWSIWRPVWEKAACDVRRVADGLLIEASSDPYAVGGVFQEVRNIKAGQAYAIKATCQLQRICAAYASVLVRVSWMRDDNLLHPAGMLVRGPIVEDGLARFDDVLVAPDGADAARLSLEVKWPLGGSVLFKQVSVRAAPAPVPRKVKVGTVYLRPRRSTPEKNLRLWCEQIDAAGKLGLDIVCLGEAVTIVGTSATIEDCAEPIPGPVTGKLGEAARRNNIWVVAGLTELDGDIIYNTAVLLDRTGRLAGKYRKVHLPREEWRKGVRPGDTYPVFQTDFGRIAIQICYDWFFPEPETIFALQGAEIIFAPTWGNTLPDEDGRVDGESVFRVRARDNGVYMVPSVYDGNSLVIDPMGRILASSRGKQGVFWAEIDLNKRECLWWVGHWRSIGPRHRMPDTYLPLLQMQHK
jgi:predicted amidohydrolase